MSTENLRTTGPPAETADVESPVKGKAWLGLAVRRWIDTSTGDDLDEALADRIDWVRAAPFAVMHLCCLGVLWVGVSPTALIVAAALYAVRNSPAT